MPVSFSGGRAASALRSSSVAAARCWLGSNLPGQRWLSTVVEVCGSEVSEGVDDSSAGDDVQFVAALEEVLPRVQRAALLLVGDRSVADDLVGEAVARRC